MSVDILPDTRARVARYVIRRVDSWGRVYNAVPVYCANCGHSAGDVPEENCTFAFFLCGPEANNCADKWGGKAHFYTEPDTVFWDRIHQEWLDKHQEKMSSVKLLAELENPESSLTKLFKERLAKGPL